MTWPTWRDSIPRSGADSCERDEWSALVFLPRADRHDFEAPSERSAPDAVAACGLRGVQRAVGALEQSVDAVDRRPRRDADADRRLDDGVAPGHLDLLDLAAHPLGDAHRAGGGRLGQ